MIKGFKDFLLRGNVIDLAVALVIGTAFAAVIKTFIDRLRRGRSSTRSGRRPRRRSASSCGITTQDVREHRRHHHAIIYFVIVAAVVYFVVVVPVNKLMERRKRGEEPEVAAPTEDIVLLQEIRDLLRQRSI